MFRLTRDEASGVAASRSQSVILKRGKNIKYLPYVFTEHGAIMVLVQPAKIVKIGVSDPVDSVLRGYNPLRFAYNPHSL